jgi:hypothetical protein
VYNADGLLVRGCGVARVSYQGATVVREHDGDWWFVPVPGLDDPIVVVKRGFSGVANVTQAWLPIISDGNGQLLAIADSAGQLQDAGVNSALQAGLWNSGLTIAAQSFNPRRWVTPGSIDTISTFRARQYDPGTGKWLQEDPTGLAGGANLYEYNGNDPNTFSDPFGTCDKPPCISADDPLHGEGLPGDVNPNDLNWDPRLGSKGGYRDQKTGKLIIPHPEDAAHWKHWDVVTPAANGKEHEQERYPEKIFKPGHGPKDQQSPRDPSLPQGEGDDSPLQQTINVLDKFFRQLGPPKPFMFPPLPGLFPVPWM